MASPTVVTKRITVEPAESTTKRITVTAVEDTTKRVATSGGTAAVAASLGTSTWGRSWGGFVSAAPAADLDDTWGRTWLTVGGAVAATAASPAADNTKRITVTVPDPA
jgi:hypothetical protein